MTIQYRKAYILRTCDANMRAYGGFQWPTSGRVTAPDWQATTDCGNGLHGLLNGEGDASYLSRDEDAKWLICEVDHWVDLGGKVKSEYCDIVAIGARDEIVAQMVTLCSGRAVPYASVQAGDGGTATAGDSGTATAGDYGTATAGNSGTATAGYRGTATAGNSGTATAGNYGTATAGNSGTATAGDYGTATAGNSGTATAGYRGTATAGDGGTATAGDWGILQIKHWDSVAQRYRIKTAYVGEDGIKADTAYRLDASGNFVEVSA